MQLRGSLNHVKFFVDAASGHRTGIAHSHHNLPSQTIGKGYQGFGNLALAVDAKLKF